MTRAFYLHQFNRGYRETTYRAFGKTAKEWGIQQIWFKSHQGGNYSASWDPAPLAFKSAADCARCFDECAAEGVQAVFWSVPQGDSWQKDAQISTDIARASGDTTHVDLENFRGFWDAPRWGVAGQVPYFQMLKDAGLTVDVSAVGRFGEPELTPWEEVVENVDSVWLQSYWTDFGAVAAGPRALATGVTPDELFARPDLALAIMDHFKDQPRALAAPGPLGITAVGVVTDDITALLRVGVPIEKIGSIFPHNGSRANMDAAYDALRALTVGRVAVWVWDYASLTPFEFMRDLTAAVQPVPPADNDATYRLIRAEFQEIVFAANEGTRLSTPGNEGGPTDVSDQDAVNGIVHAVQVIQRHAIKAVDHAAQVRV